MELTQKDKRQIFLALLDQYSVYERWRKVINRIYGEEEHDEQLRILNEEEKYHYELLKKFATETDTTLPEYKEP